MGKKKKHIPIHETMNSDAVVAWFDSFGSSHENDVLSNFFRDLPIVLPVTWGMLWESDDCAEILAERGIDPDEMIEGATGEHIFAAFKAVYLEDFIDVLRATNKRGVPDPGESKHLGQRIDLRDDWESVKYDVMMVVLRQKFRLDRPEGQRLLDTGDKLLIEGTFWEDRVWGVDLADRNDDPLEAIGRNWLGTMLMARRAELRAEQLFGVASSKILISNLAYSM